jgi:putative ABC transport system permease protein
MGLPGLALRNLYRRPTRSLLTIVAIALGIATVVALTSIAWGFEASWQKANDVRGTDLIVTRNASENTMPSPFLSTKPTQVIKTSRLVQDVVGMLSEMWSVGEASPPVFVFGWAYGSYLWDHLRLIEGRWPSNDNEPAVVVGALAAGLLHKKTGDKVEIEGRQFQVVGLFESPAMVENGALLMTLSQAQLVSDKIGKVNVLNLKLQTNVTENEIQDLKKWIGEKLPGFVAITSGELVGKNTIVRVSKAMSNATILLASILGALMVFNTMLMSINERTKEIGILLALGWRRRTVIKLIVGESSILTLAGGVIGILVGIAMALGLEHLELMRGKIDAIFPVPFLIAVLGLSILIGILGGLYPALKAAHLLPSRALRQE